MGLLIGKNQTLFFNRKTCNSDGASFFPADEHKTKITNTLQLLLNYGSRFIDKSI